MFQVKQFFFVSLIALIISCEYSPTTDNLTATGSVDVKISLGRIGYLQKSQNSNAAELKALIVSLTAIEEVAIIDTIALSGASQVDLIKSYNNLPPKQWTLNAISFDQSGTTIHSGSTTFIITVNDTTAVTLKLDAAFSKLKLHLFPVPDSAKYVKISLNNDVIIDSTTVTRSDTAKFLYNYIPVGDKKEIKCDIYGTWYGITNALLYTGKTIVEPKSGIDQFYKMVLVFVGPETTPSGTLTATIVLGKSGTEYIEASVQDVSPSNDLYCFYPFTGNAQDVSGNNHHAVVNGPQLTEDRFGNPQSAYSFDGVNDYITSGIMEDFPGNNSPKSVAGWFRSSEINPYIMMMFGFGNSKHEYNFQGGIGPNNVSSGGAVFRLNGWDDNADWRIGTLAQEYLDGKWHFCAFSYDGDTAKFYLDGKLQNSTTKYNYYTDPNQSRIIIGREIDLNGWEFKGDLDDIRVYPREISEAEVQALYHEKP